MDVATPSSDARQGNWTSRLVNTRARCKIPPVSSANHWYVCASSRCVECLAGRVRAGGRIITPADAPLQGGAAVGAGGGAFANGASAGHGAEAEAAR